MTQNYRIPTLIIDGSIHLNKESEHYVRFFKNFKSLYEVYIGTSFDEFDQKLLDHILIKLIREYHIIYEYDIADIVLLIIICKNISLKYKESGENFERVREIYHFTKSYIETYYKDRYRSHIAEYFIDFYLEKKSKKKDLYYFDPTLTKFLSTIKYFKEKYTDEFTYTNFGVLYDILEVDGFKVDFIKHKTEVVDIIKKYFGTINKYTVDRSFYNISEFYSEVYINIRGDEFYDRPIKLDDVDENLRKIITALIEQKRKKELVLFIEGEVHGKENRIIMNYLWTKTITIYI
jgi:hypothetical protein